MKRELLKTANSFEVFCCKRRERNGAVTRGVCEIKQNFLFKMREVITCLCAIGQDPVQKENLIIVERSGRVTKQYFQVDDRK